MAGAAEIAIRPAVEADCPLLLELILELARYEQLADRVVGDAETLRRTLFEERAAEALLIETAAGEAVGYAIFYVTFSSFECRSGIWLEDVYVRPDHRRGGIGRAVMEHLAGLASERGHTRLEWCALEWNQPALDFYDELGAAQLDDWVMLRLERPDIEALGGGATTRRGE
ncbi:MAG: GNAT family N-acetyltransferase [Solirubrobacterales bacterium]